MQIATKSHKITRKAFSLTNFMDMIQYTVEFPNWEFFVRNQIKT
jgi:hypothetical protein